MRSNCSDAKFKWPPSDSWELYSWSLWAAITVKILLFTSKERTGPKNQPYSTIKVSKSNPMYPFKQLMNPFLI